MAFWIALAGFVSVPVFYAVAPYEWQLENAWDVAQWHAVLLAFLGYLAFGYERTKEKAAMMLILLWCGYIAVTDYFVTIMPIWVAITEAVIFAGWVWHAVRRINAAQGREGA